MVNILKTNLPGTLYAILYKIKCTNFGLKLNLYIYKSFLNSFLSDIPFANVCTKKKKPEACLLFLRGDI